MQNEVDLFILKVPDFEKLPVEDKQKFIAELEAKTFQAIADEHLAKIEIPVEHHFSKDVYAREIKIPKGSFVIGKIHKFQNLNILSKGEISILSIDGVQRVKAPFTVVSSPGVKRVAYAHEDTVWTTIHGTAERDVEKIEEIFIAKTYEDVPLIVGGEQKCLG